MIWNISRYSEIRLELDYVWSNLYKLARVVLNVVKMLASLTHLPRTSPTGLDESQPQEPRPLRFDSFFPAMPDSYCLSRSALMSPLYSAEQAEISTDPSLPSMVDFWPPSSRRNSLLRDLSPGKFHEFTPLPTAFLLRFALVNHCLAVTVCGFALLVAHFRAVISSFCRLPTLI